MSTTLGSHGIQFRSAWVEQAWNRWELLQPSWKSRRQFLESQNEWQLYQRDFFYAYAKDFLMMQGVIRFSEEGWNFYRHHNYAQSALILSEVAPSAHEVHASLQGLAQGLENIAHQSRSASWIDAATFHAVMRKVYPGELKPRSGPVNGLLKAISHSEIEAALGALFTEIQQQFSLGASPLAIAAWTHHALTQIRPYQDGNARAAFLLTNYVLWKADFPGFYVRPYQRHAYYEALAAADNGNLQAWTEFVLRSLQQAVLYALSWGRATPLPYEEAVRNFQHRLAEWRTHHDKERSQRIMNNRYTVFDYMEENLRTFASELEAQLQKEEGKAVRVLVAKAYPDSPYYHQFTSDIQEYARRHGYYFNRGLPRGWFKLKFSLSVNKKYQLVFSLHHAGHDDATIVVGGFFHFLEPLKYQQKRLRRRRIGPRRKERTVYLFAPLPFPSEPLAFSIQNPSPSIRTLLKDYIHQYLTRALNELSNEIY
ncbi:MAG: Fic family protein [Bacteroidia bacterium]|nr:Fic family protein [Bacteroidia bacterium]MDW8235401.1 Fic family protein [Bacteroidia bacterium]